MIAALFFVPPPVGEYVAPGELPMVTPASLVVIDELRAFSPRVAEWRAGGTKVWVNVGVLALPIDDATSPDWYEQSRAGVDRPVRTGVLAVDEPAAVETRTRQLEKVIAAAGSFDGVILRVDVRAGPTYRYSPSARRMAIKACGLDPVDFRDPKLPNAQSPGLKAFDLPADVARALVESGSRVTAGLARPVAAAFAGKGRPVFLVAEPEFLDARPGARVAPIGQWAALSDLKGLTGLVMEGRDASAERLQKLKGSLAAIGMPTRVIVSGSKNAQPEGIEYLIRA